MRVWLQKQKKKEEAKAAAQAATPPVDVTPAASEVQPVGDGAEKPVDSVEDTPKAEDNAAEQAAGSAENAEEAGQRAGSASAQPNEVGFQCLFALTWVCCYCTMKRRRKQAKERPSGFDELQNMVATRANDMMLSTSPFALTDQTRTTPLLRTRPSDAVAPPPRTRPKAPNLLLQTECPTSKKIRMEQMA